MNQETKVKKTIKKLPSVMAMQRLMLVTDGEFSAKCDDGVTRPVYVERITVRAANMPADKKKEKKDGGTVAIQTVETAKLPCNAKALNVSFGMRMIDMKHSITSCLANGTNDKDIDANDIKSKINDFIENVKESESMNDVMLRYAHRVLSGSWLWRNLVLSDNISIKIERSGDSVNFDEVMDIDPDSFENYSDAHHKLAEWLLDGIRGESTDFINVTATIETGIGGLEVYPSQSFPSNDSGNVSKVLYKKFVGKVGGSETILGQAAFRDQKISNAIRTIDTWYPSEEDNVTPIPVEPYGACLSDDTFYRLKDNSGAKALENVEITDMESDEAKYLAALIIRGGVFTG